MFPHNQERLMNQGPLRKLLLGKAIASAHHEHTLLPKILALPVFASDAISSCIYAPQEILLALSAAGGLALGYTLHVSIAIVVLLAVVAVSYRQTLYAYPSGGGSYIVAKDNLGVRWGLIAAAALLIDYILTVATSIASGVQNMVSIPIFNHLKGHEVAVCVGFIAILMLLNLRGLKESGVVFSIPTYLFVVSACALVVFGLAGPHFGWVLNQPEAPQHPLEATKMVGIALFLNAFARGCSALTGTEAISNGVPAFQKPQSRNASITLAWMAVILGVLFLGISVLATKVGIVYVEGSEPVIDQVNSVVFGKGSFFYYVLQLSTVAILVLAANTSFADFPRLSAVLASDGFLPRPLMNLGDKLTFSNGIALLGLFSAALVVIFGGNTDRLIPLYAIGVFIAFTMSQAGMVVRWNRLRGPGWQIKAVVNGLGALATLTVTATMAYEKIVMDLWTNGGREFAWIVAVLIAIMYSAFRRIRLHYSVLDAVTSVEQYRPRPQGPHVVLLLVARINRGVLEAIDYCRRISDDVRGVHVGTKASDTERLRSDWQQWAGDLPLILLESPYRSIITPLLTYLEEVDQGNPDGYITVVVAESVTSKWWHNLLHSQSAAFIKLYLLQRRNVAVTNLRYFADREPLEFLPRLPSPDAPDIPASIPPQMSGEYHAASLSKEHEKP